MGSAGSGYIRWVVQEEDGPTLGGVLTRAGADAGALAEGRVFVGRQRASDASAQVHAGDVVTLSRSAPVSAPVSILAEIDGLVAVSKPAGIPTIPDLQGSAHSLQALVADAVGCRAQALHATSRLDRDVSGVVVFARSPESAERLRDARNEGTYFRRYVALSQRAPEPARGEWDAPIGRAADRRKRAVRGAEAEDARSRYALVATASGRALLALDPQTGRTHQLRVHAAHAGAPLLGDRAYGGETRLVLSAGKVLSVRRIALHAARVVVPRRGGTPLELVAEVPEELRRIWQALGGEDAWEKAVGAPPLPAGGGPGGVLASRA